jgi:hypothetical protein
LPRLLALLPGIAASTGLRRALTGDTSRLTGPRKYYYGLLATKFQSMRRCLYKRPVAEKTVQDSRVSAFELIAATDIPPAAYMRALYRVTFEIRPTSFGALNRFLIAGRQMM